jgi:hypothetical protein
MKKLRVVEEKTMKDPGVTEGPTFNVATIKGKEREGRWERNRRQ